MKAVVFDNELKLDKNYAKPIPQKGEALRNYKRLHGLQRRTRTRMRRDC